MTRRPAIAALRTRRTRRAGRAVVAVYGSLTCIGRCIGSVTDPTRS